MNRPAGAGGAPRNNGLVARAYVAVVECDPRLADALLTALREAGVAAYVAPSAGRAGGYLEVRLPSRPVDRLYVDAARRVEAEDVLRATLPDGADLDPGTVSADDAAFAEIVAGLSLSHSGPTRPWPAAEDLPDSASALPATLPPTPLVGPAPVPVAPPPARPSPDSEEDAEEHYDPPVLGPQPRASSRTRSAWVLLLVGITLLLSPVLPGLSATGSLQVLGIFSVLGSVATAVWHLRDGRDDDDGAVV